MVLITASAPIKHYFALSPKAAIFLFFLFTVTENGTFEFFMVLTEGGYVFPPPEAFPVATCFLTGIFPFNYFLSSYN